MSLTKAQLQGLNTTNFPNNTTGYITPSLLREFNSQSVDSMALQTQVDSLSSSFQSQLNGLEDFSSSLVTNFATVTQLNASSSTLQSNINGRATTGSVNTLSQSVYVGFDAQATINSNTNNRFNTNELAFNQYTQSNNLAVAGKASLSQDNYFVGNQYVTGNITATGTVTGSNITSFALPTASFNSYTASQNFTNSTLVTTSSFNTFSGSQYKADSASFSSRIEAVTGSGGTVNTGSLVTTSSFNSYTSSNDSKVNSLIAATASYVTSAITGSSLITASVSQSTITFTKGDGSQFNIVVADVSGSAGNFVTTSSFNAYTQSTNDFTASISTSVGLLQTFSGSQYKGDSSSFDSRINGLAVSGNILVVQEEGTILGPATSMNFIGSGVTATISAGTASVTVTGGGASGGATTGSNTFTGDQTILGSIVSNPTTSLTELFSQAFVSGATQYNITASAAVSQSNIVFGGTPLASTQNGSVVVSGSGNLLFSPSKISTGANAFTKGYVGGNNNYFTVIPTLHTQSLFNPTMNSNIGTGTLTLNFITSSLGVPTISNNNFSSTITLNHQSGTVSMQNNISNGTITSTQNGLTSGTIVAQLNGNIVGGGGLTLNHNSSSILTTNNTLLGVTTVTNNYYHTGSGGNSLSLTNNITNGQAITITAAGNPATDITRPIANNLLGGQTIAVSAQAAGTDLGGLRSGIIYGYNLIVSGAHATATTTNQGTAYFGRYNDINAGLADSGKTIFAVGTGTSTSARKTALSVDSSSVVNISGSLTVTSSTLNIDGSGNVTASTFLATNNGSTAFIYNQQSTGSVSGVWNTNYGKDGLQIYQYQGQPYAFNVILAANQIAAYTGSEFQWGLQTNGTLSLPGGGSTYFAMSSGSTITGSGGGATKVGLDYLETAMIMDFKADTAFNRKVYVDKGMYVSQSVGGSPTPALIVNGTNAASSKAIVATGSVDITGSLTVNGSNLATLGSNTFTQNQIVSASIYIAPNNNSNQLYLPSGSNKQTGLATLDGGNPGTVTVSNTNVTANSIIMLTKQTNNHPNAGPVNVSSKGSGTFTITSNHNGDTDVVAFMIINPS